MNDASHPSESHCPACRAPIAGQRDECAACGVIFGKVHSTSLDVPSALPISPPESTAGLVGSSLRASLMALLGVIVFFAVTFGLWAALAYIGVSTGVLAICRIAPAWWAVLFPVLLVLAPVAAFFIARAISRLGVSGRA